MPYELINSPGYDRPDDLTPTTGRARQLGTTGDDAEDSARWSEAAAQVESEAGASRSPKYPQNFAGSRYEVMDGGQPSQQQQPDPNKLGPEASAIVRPAVEGVFGALTFVPDLVTDVVNLIPESALGPKTRSLGDRWESILDKYTTKPDTTLGKVAEFGASALLGGGLARKAVKAVESAGKGIAKHAFNKITSQAAQDVSKAGYKLSPDYIGGHLSRTAQTIAGGPKLQKTFSSLNQSVTDRLAAAELGYHGDIEFTPEFFEDVKAEAYAPYEEARSLGISIPTREFFRDVREAGGRFATMGKSFGNTSRFKSIEDLKAPYLNARELHADDLVNEMKSLRASSNANFKVHGAGADEARALAYTQRELATAMEKQLGRMAGNGAGLPERLDASRKQLSKIFAVEDSIDAGGHVRASDFSRMMEKKVPLTGGFKTIATMAKHFPKDVQNVAKQGETGDFSAIDYLLGGTGLIHGYTGTAGLVIARPLTRATLGTKYAQGKMLKGMRRAHKPNEVKRSLVYGTAIEGYHDAHEFDHSEDR